MKVRGKINVLNRLSWAGVPCTPAQFTLLKQGKAVDLKDEVAKDMLELGIVEENKTKKGSK